MPVVYTRKGCKKVLTKEVYHLMSSKGIKYCLHDDSEDHIIGIDGDYSFIDLHNEAGPALIPYVNPDDKLQELFPNLMWCFDGYDITDQVHKWIADNNIGPWETWTSKEKVLFKLKFGGE